MTKHKLNKISIEDIEKEALQNKNVNGYFTKGHKMPPLNNIQRVNVDFTRSMLKQLDQFAKELNISRQAVVKTLLTFAINQHRMSLKMKG
ncbi:MAG: hypothetical protein HY843_03770 [Bdellovibrio sp.]|nr:hypothetical protein [Bdellovibrio sp.]